MSRYAWIFSVEMSCRETCVPPGSSCLNSGCFLLVNPNFGQLSPSLSCALAPLPFALASLSFSPLPLLFFFSWPYDGRVGDILSGRRRVQDLTSRQSGLIKTWTAYKLVPTEHHLRVLLPAHHVLFPDRLPTITLGSFRKGKSQWMIIYVSTLALSYPSQ